MQQQKATKTAAYKVYLAGPFVFVVAEVARRFAKKNGLQYNNGDAKMSEIKGKK